MFKASVPSMTPIIDLIAEECQEKDQAIQICQKEKQHQMTLDDTLQMTLHYGTSISVNAKHMLSRLEKVKDLSQSSVSGIC